MSNFWKIFASLTLVLAVVFLVSIFFWRPALAAGAVGVKLAENYDPYLRYNNGYYSNLPIQTTSTITAGGLFSAVNALLTGTLAASSTITEGGNNSTTTPASLTIQASDLNFSTIYDTPTVGSVTLTLPASTTLTTLVPNAGDTRQLVIINATSTAGTNVTIAGGTGTLLQNSSTTAAILAGKSAVVQITRKANTDIIFSFTPFD